MPSNLELFPSHRSNAAGTEWVGGQFTMPFEIEGARPLVVLWVELPLGRVVYADIRAAAEVEGWFEQTLRTAMKRPAVGKPRRPSRIRVADRALARELQDAGVGVEIVVAAAPEVDEAFRSLSMAMRAKAANFVEDGVLAPKLTGELFGAAERLYRLAPWKFVDDVIRADIPGLGIDGACLALIGQGRSEYGMLLFPSVEAYEEFCEIGATLAAGEEEPEGIGTSFLSLSFEKRADIAPSTLRAIKQHKWPVAGAKAYPLAEHRDETGALLPLQERDARVLVACANAIVAFCALHRDVLSAQSEDSVCESFTGDDDLTVRLTYPIEDADLFDVEEPPPWESETVRSSPAPRRNDPCHCGSGRKYKKCHLDVDQQAAEGPGRVHTLDKRLFDELIRFGAKRFGTEWLPKELTIVPPEDALHLILQWAAYELPVEGRSLIEHFMERRDLGAEETAWVGAQRRAWISIWEVLSVVPGREIAVRDLLTGERRTVLEREGSRSLRARDAILARVIDHAGVSLFCGMYTRSLPPLDAAGVVRDVRTRLRVKAGDVAIDRLRGKTAGRFMISRWADAVGELDERRSRPVALTNTDGDPIAFVIDQFSFDRGSRQAVESRLAALDGAGDPDRDGDETNIPLVKPGRRDDEDATVIAQLFVGERMLRIETNSEQRAAPVRRQVEEACGELLRHRSREQKDPTQSLGDRRRQAVMPLEPTAEEQQLLGEFKQRYYRKWLDEPIPALRGKTPRQAARSRAGRADLDLLLRHIENREAMLAEAERFDVSRIRDELGL